MHEHARGVQEARISPLGSALVVSGSLGEAEELSAVEGAEAADPEARAAREASEAAYEGLGAGARADSSVWWALGERAMPAEGTVKRRLVYGLTRAMPSALLAFEGNGATRVLLDIRSLVAGGACLQG